MVAENWVALGGIVVGVIAFGFGLFEFRRAQKWKRLEFVANEIKEFLSKPSTKNAISMLDWNARLIEFSPNIEKEEGKLTKVTDDLLCTALVTHDVRDRYSKEEVAIRDTFDQFLDDLEQFHTFVETGLVSAAEFKPYLVYWIDIMANRNGERKPVKFVDAFLHYLDFYSYSSVLNLFRLYGYPKG